MEDLNNLENRIRAFEKNEVRHSSKVPDGYFDSFQSKVHKKVYKESSNGLWLRSLGFGSLATIVLILATFLLKPNNNDAFVEIESQDIASYYQEHIDLITLEDVYEVAPDEVIEELGDEIQQEMNDKEIKETEIMDEISKEDIIEYLIEEETETLDWEYL